MENKIESTNLNIAFEAKKEWQAPELKKFDAVTEMTMGASGTLDDGGAHTETGASK